MNKNIARFLNNRHNKNEILKIKEDNMRFYTDLTLFDELNKLHREVARVFDEVSTSRGNLPAVNILMSQDELKITSLIPGVEKENLDIQISGDLLQISGEITEDKNAKKESISYHRKERFTGKFSRTIELPYAVASDKANAELKNGVLTVTLPIAEKEKPKKIGIKALN